VVPGTIGVCHSSKFQCHKQLAGDEWHHLSKAGHQLDGDSVEALFLQQYLLHSIECHVLDAVVLLSYVGFPVDDVQQQRRGVSHDDMLQQVAVHVDLFIITLTHRPSSFEFSWSVRLEAKPYRQIGAKLQIKGTICMLVKTEQDASQ